LHDGIVFYSRYSWRPRSHYEKPRKAGKKKPNVKQPLESPPAASADSLLLEALSSFSKAVIGSIRAFQASGVSFPVIAEDVRESWFSHRFSAFSRLHQPKPLQIEEWEPLVSGRSPEELFKSAEETFKITKQLLTSVISHAKPGPFLDLAYAKGMLRATVMNSLALASRGKTFEKMKTEGVLVELRLSFDSNSHAATLVLATKVPKAKESK
jgi:hypothetical protein